VLPLLKQNRTRSLSNTNGPTSQDVSRIPTLEDLEPSFSEYLPPYLVKIAKSLARAIYPHWKDRRIRAGGKNINPQLDVRFRCIRAILSTLTPLLTFLARYDQRKSLCLFQKERGQSRTQNTPHGYTDNRKARPAQIGLIERAGIASQGARTREVQTRLYHHRRQHFRGAHPHAYDQA
jgi:hypothetical protein